MDKIPDIWPERRFQTKHIDHFLYKVFTNTGATRDKVCDKNGESTFAHSNSNANVERSLNVSMSNESIIGLRATYTVTQEHTGVNKMPMALHLVKVVQNAHKMYTGDQKQEEAMER